MTINAKAKNLVLIYSLAAIVCVGGLIYSYNSRLGWYRLAADYSSLRAFDECAVSVAGLSESLEKLCYITEDSLGRSVCSNAYAQAMSAQAALSVLPFSTHELEQLSAFLNRSGDYTASLCAQAEDELSPQQRKQLRSLSDTAGDFSAKLLDMQSRLANGSLLMDSMEKLPENVGQKEGSYLSAELLGYEADFKAPEEFVYDGKFSPGAEPEPGDLSAEEAKALAAQAAGVELRELRDEYSYEGPEGRRCYSAGEYLICVSSRGLESMSQSRLVGYGGVSPEQAGKTAEKFLAELGYEDLALSYELTGETMAAYRYAPTQDGAIRQDDYISVSVALDDGSIYSFDATRYSDVQPELEWNISEAQARETAPEDAEIMSAEKLIIKSPGGNYLPCWALKCTGSQGDEFISYVNADTGKQCKLELI